MADETGTPLASITGQVPSVGKGLTGQTEEGYSITFTTRSGAIGKVFVGTAQFTPEVVQNLVREAATKLEAVQGAKIY